MKALMILMAALSVSALGFAQSPGSTGASGGSTGSSPSTTGLDTPVGTYGAPAGPTGSSKVGDAISNRPLNPQTGTNGTTATDRNLQHDKFAKSPRSRHPYPNDTNTLPSKDINPDANSGSNR